MSLYLSVCENPLTEREKAILSKTTPIVTPTDSLTDMSEEEVAPPKPPLPGVKLAEHRWGGVALEIWKLLLWVQKTQKETDSFSKHFYKSRYYFWVHFAHLKSKDWACCIVGLLSSKCSSSLKNSMHTESCPEYILNVSLVCHSKQAFILVVSQFI